MSAGEKLGVSLDVWSSPTAVILGTRDHHNPREERTEVIRLKGAGIDLRRLYRVDDVAARVIDGRLNIEQGRLLLEQAERLSHSTRFRLETIAGFLLAAIGVAGLLGGSWPEMLLAGTLSMLIAAMDLGSSKMPALGESLDAVAALVVSIAVGVVAHLLFPVSTRIVLIASLIVLVPGLTLTTAAAEIATGHLVSGTARMTGAFATLLKLAFGSLVGSQIVARLHLLPLEARTVPMPEWIQWPSLLLSALSFAMLFRARLVDYPVAMAAAILSYLISRFGTEQLGPEFGVFLAGFCINVLSNAYARTANRPGALVRLPGLILLVPGTVGFRSLSFVFEKDVFLGLDTAVSMLLIVVSLVAGLLFANTVVQPRRAL